MSSPASPRAPKPGRSSAITRRSCADARDVLEPVLPAAAEPVDEQHGRALAASPIVHVVHAPAADLHRVQVRPPVDLAPVRLGARAVVVARAARASSAEAGAHRRGRTCLAIRPRNVPAPWRRSRWTSTPRCTTTGICWSGSRSERFGVRAALRGADRLGHHGARARAAHRLRRGDALRREHPRAPSPTRARWRRCATGTRRATGST